jgi:SAM-dependent methyltransferase
VSCLVCGGVAGSHHVAKEMMFGLREEFRYFECAGCGYLQIAEPPADMQRYYPPEYYSFGAVAPVIFPPAGLLRRWMFHGRNRAQIFRRGWVFWRWLAARRPRRDFVRLGPMLAPARVRDLHARILDVGCGSGDLLHSMAAAGFRSLKGIDPFVGKDIDLGRGLQILAQPFESLQAESFDLIMFHHSLEHMKDQIRTLSWAAGRLAPGGAVLIRMPLAGSDPWRVYGTNWIELDAPRHFYLHTTKSFAMAARKAGLENYHTLFETSRFAYWGSELYRRGMPYYDPTKGSLRRPGDYFTAGELKHFDSLAKAANDRGAGSSAAFYLQRAK